MKDRGSKTKAPRAGRRRGRRHRPPRSLGLALLAVGLLLLMMVATNEAAAAAAAAQPEIEDAMDGESKSPPPPPRPQQRTFQEVLAIAGRQALGGGLPGALAAALQVLALMPLRTVSNWQCRFGGSFPDAVAALVKSGGFPRLYEGLSFAIVQGPLARFGATAANAGVRALLQNMALTEDLPLIAATALAAVAAGCWRLLLMPIDVCKTVAQVQGVEGFRALMRRVVAHGDVSPLYQGAVATAIAVSLGHFPWWSTHDYLSERIPRPHGLFLSIVRNGFIGFLASAVADLCTNSIRVIKVTKQTVGALSSLSYLETIQVVLAADGVKGLFGRGLGTRILTNGIQAVLFTILWEALREGMADAPPPSYDAAAHGGGLAVDASKEQQQRQQQQQEKGEGDEGHGEVHHIRGPVAPGA